MQKLDTAKEAPQKFGLDPAAGTPEWMEGHVIEAVPLIIGLKDILVGPSREVFGVSCGSLSTERAWAISNRSSEFNSRSVQ